jgi:hypothetical protein
LEFTRNVVIIDVPHYNGGGQAIELEYKGPSKMINHSLQITYPAVAKLAKKYKREDRDY